MIKFLFKLFISFLPIILLYFIGEKILGSEVQIIGFISYYYLVLVLLIAPLGYISYKFKKLKKYSNLIISFRRPVGILVGILALIHIFKFGEKIFFMWQEFYGETVLVKFIYNSILNSQGSIFGMNSYSFWFGTIATIIIILLLFISNNFSQRILGAKIWTKLQKLVYPLFILLVLHIYFVGGLEGIYLYPAIFLVLTRLYVFLDKNFEYKGSSHDTISGYRKFLCLPCGFIYDEEFGDIDGGLPAGTKFEEIPEDRKCPVCGVTKKDFILLDGNYNPENIESHELNFELKSKKFLTNNVLELAFYCEKKLDIIPGQFCNLVFNFNAEENKIIRSYSVLKYIDNNIYFGIKLKENGKGSEFLKIIKKGEKIKALGPFGNFVLQNTSKKKIFIATGTGLSPIFYMIKKSWNIEKELYFGVQKESDLFYLEELKKIPNLKINIYLSQEKNINYNYGRIDYENLNLEGNPEIYMCGNPSLLESFIKKFEKSGNKNIYFEKFL